eukprot:Gb_14535 [translate_table: standard]
MQMGSANLSDKGGRRLLMGGGVIKEDKRVKKRMTGPDGLRDQEPILKEPQNSFLMQTKEECGWMATGFNLTDLEVLHVPLFVSAKLRGESSLNYPMLQDDVLIPLGVDPECSKSVPFFCIADKGLSDMMSQLELEKSEAPPIRHRSVNGIFWLLLLNIDIFADKVISSIIKLEEWKISLVEQSTLNKVDAIKLLYLYHDAPRWYQFITATFCHVNCSSSYVLYVEFHNCRKLVEEEEGGFALWASYLITGAGANLVSWLILPGTIISVGASGAVFGLFAVSVLVKISWDWRKILEVLILGQFVIEKIVLRKGELTASLAWGTMS